MLCLFVAFPAIAAAKNLRILIVPFRIHSDQDQSWIRAGISDILISRLENETNEVILVRETAVLNRKAAILLGKAEKADMVIFGAVSLFGKRVSIDGKMVDTTGGPGIAIMEESGSMDDVIPRIRAFADRILALQSKSTPPPKLPVPPALSRNPMAATWESPDIKMLVNGISAGDVDGDGLLETVFITDKEIFAMKFADGKFSEPKMIGMDRFNQYVGIDIADINGNGIEEIFVTSLNAFRNNLDSVIIEWDGQKFSRIVSSGPWYFRVMDPAGAGKKLLGQRDAVPNPFSGKICEMKLGQWNPACTGRFSLLARINLLGFCMGYMGGRGEQRFAFDEKDRICFLDKSGSPIPAGSEAYGGSTLHVNLPKTDDGQVENHCYLPTRLLLHDINGNGEKEIVTAVNQEVGGRRFAAFRKFSGGFLTGLSWDGVKLATAWQTRKSEGFIRDFSIRDFDNDKTNELLAAIVIKDQATIFSSPKFRILVWDIPGGQDHWQN